jgi:signal-transduction protein with cAMP-binding, CBS, and nucleotidyltransferase domain
MAAAANRGGEMSDAHRHTITQLLKTLPLFSGLAPNTLAALVHACPVSHFAAGHCLIAENQPTPASLYVVLAGQARVTINGTEVGRLQAGDLAGEISSAGISPPVADVVAATDMQALAIPHAVLRELVAGDAAFKQRLRRTAFARIRE